MSNTDKTTLDEAIAAQRCRVRDALSNLNSERLGLGWLEGKKVRFKDARGYMMEGVVDQVVISQQLDVRVAFTTGVDAFYVSGMELL